MCTSVAPSTPPYDTGPSQVNTLSGADRDCSFQPGTAASYMYVCCCIHTVHWQGHVAVAHRNMILQSEFDPAPILYKWSHVQHKYVVHWNKNKQFFNIFYLFIFILPFNWDCTNNLRWHRKKQLNWNIHQSKLRLPRLMFIFYNKKEDCLVLPLPGVDLSPCSLFSHFYSPALTCHIFFHYRIMLFSPSWD